MTASSKKSYDIEVHWHICLTCNFDCRFCFFRGSRKTACRGYRDTKKILDGFDRLGASCLINISGGEPFLYDGFVGLCASLSEKHFLCINTNLSREEVYEFAENIDPGRVGYLNCSVNISERERLGLLEDYIEKFTLLEERGFSTLATYVMYPPFLERFENDYAYFRSHGITLRPKVFRGRYGNNALFAFPGMKKVERYLAPLYPDSYTAEQKTMILDYIRRGKTEDRAVNRRKSGYTGRVLDPGLDERFMSGLPSFKGKYCAAGKSFVRMTPNGDVHRCHGGDFFLGNLFEGTVVLFDKPEKCPFDVCRCPYLGYEYVQNES